MKKIIIFLISIISIISLTGCKVKHYSEEEIIEEVHRLINLKYFNNNNKYEYTSYELYPVYNDKDIMEYLLIEFEPYGFVFIQIRYEAKFSSNSKFLSCGTDREIYKGWSKYEIKNGISIYERDENKKYIYYNISPFKKEGFLNEKKYLIQIAYNSYYYIPAIKVENKYLNLII